jgi:hypothetical protein
MFSPMEAIPPPVRSLLDLFATALSEVRFADLDAQTLARAAADVESAAADVATAQAMLDRARNGLREQHELLIQCAQRALAYARVYAENDASLAERIESIALPKPVRAARRTRSADDAPLTSDTEAPHRPRGRPRKTVVEASTPLLP